MASEIEESDRKGQEGAGKGGDWKKGKREVWLRFRTENNNFMELILASFFVESPH